MEEETTIKNDVPQVSWNLSSCIIQEIAEHLVNSSRYFTLGKIANSYWELVVIEMRIGTYLDAKEKAELYKLSGIITKGIKENSSLEEKMLSSACFRKYNDLIMDYLKKYGFLIKPAEDSKKMF
jgi:hypothetical protein